MEREMLEQYKECIKDRFVWLYIFGKEKPRLDNTDEVIRCMNNTINLTFMYVLSCVRNMYGSVVDIEDKKRLFNSNALRAIKNIDRIYNDLDISYELINYILLDIQFDLSLSDESCLKQFIPGISADFMPLDYSPLVLSWMSSANLDSIICFDDLIKLFQKMVLSLPFLRLVNLVENGPEVFFETRVGFDKVPLYTDYKIHIKDCGRGFYQLYFLERFEVKDHSCILHYSTPDYADKYDVVYYDDDFNGLIEDDDEHTFIQHNSDEMEMLCSGITGSDIEMLQRKNVSASKEIRNLYAVNYKYLKNLSLAIADELGNADNALYREQFFKLYKIDSNSEIDLDSIIIMELIKDSPSRVLYNLFYINNHAFHAIIRNLNLRFNGNVKFAYVDFDKRPADFSVLDEKIINRLNSGNRKSELAELQANYVISMMLSAPQWTIALNSGMEPTAIKSGLSELQSVLTQSLIRICAFYHGILAYGKLKMQYDAKHINKVSTEEETNEASVNLQNCFINAAKDFYDSQLSSKLKSMDAVESLKYAVEQFRTLIDDFGMNSSERYLKCVLGKTQIMDKEHLALFDSLTELDEEQQIKQIYSCLEFLHTGSLDNNESHGDFNSSIFPVKGKYRSSSESDDQCHIASFSLRIDVDYNGQYDYVKTINVLSEFTYQINRYYYCLPNITRCNIDWWIDPLIISASDFESIFK